MTSYESLPSIENDTQPESGVSYELLTYVFGYMPPEGHTVALEQIAEDLEETPDTILQALHELKLDKFLDFTTADNTVTVTYRDEEFLQVYSVYQSVR